MWPRGPNFIAKIRPRVGSSFLDPGPDFPVRFCPTGPIFSRGPNWILHQYWQSKRPSRSLTLQSRRARSSRRQSKRARSSRRQSRRARSTRQSTMMRSPDDVLHVPNHLNCLKELKVSNGDAKFTIPWWNWRQLSRCLDIVPYGVIKTIEMYSLHTLCIPLKAYVLIIFIKYYIFVCSATYVLKMQYILHLGNNIMYLYMYT